MAGKRGTGQMNPGVVLRKAAVYAAGLLFMAFGVAFSVNSGLGGSSVNIRFLPLNIVMYIV